MNIKIISLIILLFFTHNILAEENAKQTKLVYQIGSEELIIKPEMVSSIEMAKGFSNEETVVINYTDEGFEKVKGFINNNVFKKVIIKVDEEVVISVTIMEKINVPSAMISGMSEEQIEKVKKYINKKAN